MEYNQGEDLPLMLWKNSIHHKIREFCSIVEGTPYLVRVSQIDDLKSIGLTYPALGLVDKITPTGYFNRDQYELEAELGRYWGVHPETNQVEVYPVTPAQVERDMLPEVAELLKLLLL